MSFHFLALECSPLVYKGRAEAITVCQVVPSEKLLSEIHFSKDLEIKPMYGLKEICQSFLEAILDFDVHSSDVFVCSLPKCGSSWTQNIVWLLTHGLRYEDVDTIFQSKRITFDYIPTINAAEEKAREILLDHATSSLTEDVAYKMGWNEMFNTSDTTRVIKTHNPVYFLPKKIWHKAAKVIYVVRNPKDMIVSLFHMLRHILHTEITLDDLINRVTSDKFLRAPYLNHILNFWRIKQLPNVLIIAYEDLVMNSFETIKKMSTFLECKYTDDQLKELMEYISFDKMKTNRALNREDDYTFQFLRRGKVGGYRDELNQEQINKIDNWIQKGLEATDFQFKI